MDVLWEVEGYVRDQQFPLRGCVDNEPRAPVDETYPFKDFATGIALKIKVRQGQLYSDGCDAGYQGFHPDNVSRPNIEAEYLYSNQVWYPAQWGSSQVGNNRYADFVSTGLAQKTTTVITKVKRNDIEQPIPEPLPDPQPLPEPLPVPFFPIVPFPEPVRPLTEPEPEPLPETQPIPSPNTPNAPPFAPPKALPAPPVEVPTEPIVPLPLPTEPAQVPDIVPLPVPEVPPQTEPAIEPEITPAPGPDPDPVPNPNPEPGPTPLPEVVPSPEPRETPIPTPAPLPGVSPSPNPLPLPEGAFPIWPWRPPAPPANNIVPRTPPGYHFPVRGEPPVTPGGARPSLPALTDEAGRLEQKSSSLMEKVGFMLGLLDALEDLLGDGVLPSVTYNLQGICEDVEEDAAQPSQSWIIPEMEKLDAIGQRLDYIAEMFQVHLGFKTPICTPQPEPIVVEGAMRTISFRSDETSPYGKSRLRKRFRYRSSSGLGLGEVVDHWRLFEWNAGPVCVIHAGSSCGTPQCWAADESEGKRVIRHAFAEAGIDPDQVGRWIVSGSDNARVGVSGQMRVDTTGGYYWITARDGSNGRPIVARD